VGIPLRAGHGPTLQEKAGAGATDILQYEKTLSTAVEAIKSKAAAMGGGGGVELVACALAGSKRPSGTTSTAEFSVQTGHGEPLLEH